MSQNGGTFQKFFFLLTQGEKRLSANKKPLLLRRSAKERELLEKNQ